MTSQIAKQILTIQILLNISRSKGNQSMKFGLLIEYNMRNNFLEKSYTKCDRGANPRPFYKNNRLFLLIFKWTFTKIH